MAVQDVSAYGDTIAFGTSGYAPKIRDYGIDGMERGAVNYGHLGVTAYASGVSGFIPFVPAGLIDGGELTMQVVSSLDEFPPISADTETITITFTNSGSSTDGTIAFPGFCTGASLAGSDDDGYIWNITVKVAGEPTWTDPT